VPTDAPIRHWTEDLRDAYDAEHGAGAYDAMMAEQAFRKQVNEQGGWYDENGEWVAATGYYDEQGEWYVDVSLPCTTQEGNSPLLHVFIMVVLFRVAYEGYYDEHGMYRKYAKVAGDLSFMV
jgi:hypothetical protein